MFIESLRVVAQPGSDKNGLSSFQALMVSTASRVGTGNIAGISTAICLGGSGAVFWMWLTAILGSASAFIESTLAQIYKHKAKDGSSYGGPAYYIQAALKKRWIGVLFAVVLILTYMGGFNLVASFNIADSFRVYSFFNPEWTPLIVGAILAVVFALAVFGGSKKISQITEVLVPGDMVSSLIIVKLPFAVPDPISEAEKETYESLEAYIQSIIVPDMQKRLRQGFGRAIRTETDTCVVSILDNRAVQGGKYHEDVLNALPTCQMAEELREVQAFIRSRKGVEYYL